MTQPTLLIQHIDRLLTMNPGVGRQGDLGVIQDGAIVVEGEHITWVGPTSEAPQVDHVVDGRGCIGLPGLVDCHTHLIWAGSRADEFQERLAGRPYSEILEAGGGILSTVRTTRQASDETLLNVAARRLRSAVAQGITTIEVKSGYGLSPADEARLLRLARMAGEMVGVRVRTTFLGAHTVPGEWRHDRQQYVQQVITEQLPMCAPYADQCDVYVDRGAFTVSEGRAILLAGQALGLGARIHAEQVTYTGAAQMAAELGAASADHLERIDDAGIQAMAASKTVAVLLPGAMLYLRDPAPPVAQLRAAGVPMAVATDYNPGTSLAPDLWTAMTLACINMGLTVEETLLGATRHAASALGLTDVGQVAPGFAADIVLMKPPAGYPAHEASLVQQLGGHRAHQLWMNGQTVSLASSTS